MKRKEVCKGGRTTEAGAGSFYRARKISGLPGLYTEMVGTDYWGILYIIDCILFV
jgi:hypothetical protein